MAYCAELAVSGYLISCLFFHFTFLSDELYYVKKDHYQKHAYVFCLKTLRIKSTRFQNADFRFFVVILCHLFARYKWIEMFFIKLVQSLNFPVHNNEVNWAEKSFCNQIKKKRFIWAPKRVCFQYRLIFAAIHFPGIGFDFAELWAAQNIIAKITLYHPCTYFICHKSHEFWSLFYETL